MPLLRHKCEYCKHENKIDVLWIDPKLYTNPVTASVTRNHWCSNHECNKLIGVRYRFPDENSVQVIEDVKPKPSTTLSPMRLSPTKENKEHSEERATVEVGLDQLFGKENLD